MREEIRAVETDFYGAMLAGDAERLARLMAEDCVYVHSYGSRDSKASYLEKVRSGFFVYQKLEFTQDKVIERGDVAIVAGTMSGLVTAGGVHRRLNNIRASVWSRENGEWKLLLFEPTPWLDRQ